MQQLKKLGPLSGVLNMIPGVSGKLGDAEAQKGEEEMQRTIAIIHSMTAQERERPGLLNPSRKRRIAAGSGTQVSDVNKLIRQLESIQKLFRSVSGKKGSTKKGRRRRMPMLPGMGGPMGPGGGF